MKDICRVLQVSVSGYYRWVRRKDRPTRDELLSAAIKEVLDEHPWNDNYGARRMHVTWAKTRGRSFCLARVIEKLLLPRTPNFSFHISH